MSGDTCEWGDCENVATREVWFMSPSESVEYCEECVQEVKRRFDYQGVKRI